MIDLDDEIKKDKERRKHGHNRNERYGRPARHDDYRPSYRKAYEHRPAVRERALLKVKNLHYAVTKEELENNFKKYGPIKMCWIDWDRMGRSNETATVQFVEKDHLEEALREMQGAEINGQAITLQRNTEKVVPKRHNISKGGFGDRHRSYRPPRPRDSWN